MANSTVGICWCPFGDLVFNDQYDYCEYKFVLYKLLCLTIFPKANLNFKIVGICPGDKVPTLTNPLLCTCRKDSIEISNDKCVMCSVGEEVPNEDQTACVGMSFKIARC